MKSLKIIFAGTPEFSAEILKSLLQTSHEIIAVYTQPDRPAGRGRKLTPCAVKQVALENNIPVLQPQTLKNESEQNKLFHLKADLMIVVAYGLILPKPVLEAPKYGCMNIHASLLPRWRGAAPIQRSILTGDTYTGITIMQMNEGLDTGDMLYKSECRIEPNDTSKSLHDKLAQLGAQAIQTTIDKLITNTLTREKQDEHQATYAHKISKEEAMIDWHTYAIDIDRKIRAFNPWPVVQTMFDNQVVRIWQAQSLENEIKSGAGSIIDVSREGIDVATGRGVLRIQKMQLPGGRVLDVSEVLNARGKDFVKNKMFG